MSIAWIKTPSDNFGSSRISILFQNKKLMMLSKNTEITPKEKRIWNVNYRRVFCAHENRHSLHTQPSTHENNIQLLPIVNPRFGKTRRFLCWTILLFITLENFRLAFKLLSENYWWKLSLRLGQQKIDFQNNFSYFSACSYMFDICIYTMLISSETLK